MQRVTGINFYATFKPYTLEELRAMGVTPLYAVQDLLDQGVDPEEIFDRIGDFSDGYAKVRLNNKWNLIDTQGKLVSPNQWFDFVYNFYNGYTRVILNGKWYKIDTKGNIVAAVNEHTVVIAKSVLRKIVLECVEKIRGIS